MATTSCTAGGARYKQLSELRHGGRYMYQLATCTYYDYELNRVY